MFLHIRNVFIAKFFRKFFFFEVLAEEFRNLESKEH